MNHAEAGRQWQIALENRRRARHLDLDPEDFPEIEGDLAQAEVQLYETYYADAS